MSGSCRKKARKATVKATRKEAPKVLARAADAAAPARARSRRPIRVPADEDEPMRLYSLVDPGEDDGELCRICLRGHSFLPLRLKSLPLPFPCFDY